MRPWNPPVCSPSSGLPLSSSVLQVPSLVIWFGGRWLVQGTGDRGRDGGFPRIHLAVLRSAEELRAVFQDYPDCHGRSRAGFYHPEHWSRRSKTGPGLWNCPHQGTCSLENVSFAYDGDDYVLRDVHLEVQPGQTIALVGHTGAGKTSAINLLCRFTM